MNMNTEPLRPYMKPFPDPGSEKVEFDWSIVTQFIRRYGWTVLSVFLATVISGYAALSLYTDQYEISAELLVKLGRENLDPPAISRNMPLSTGLRPQDLQSEIEILRSPELIGQLVQKIGVEEFRIKRVPPPGFFARIKYEVKSLVRSAKELYQDTLIALDLKKRLPEAETVIQDLTERIAAEPRKDSDVISVHMRYANPELGIRVINELVNLYLQRRIGVRQNTGVKEYLDARVKSLAEDLEQVEKAKMSFKRSRALDASPAEQKAVVLQQVQELSLVMGQTSREVESLQKQIATARELIAKTPAYERTSESVTPNSLIQSLREKVTVLEAERVQLLARYKESSVTVRNLDAQLKSLRDMIARETPTQQGTVISNINPIRQNLEQKLREDSVRLAGLEASLAEQQKQMARLQTQLHSLDESEALNSVLDRKRQLAEEDYRSVLKRRTEAEVSDQLDQNRISNVSILSAAVASLLPVYPPKLIAMAVILAAGVILGIAVSLVLHYTDSRVVSGADLERATGLTFLGEVDRTSDYVGS